MARLQHNDLGDHYYRCGDLQGALKNYTRTRDYLTSPKQLIQMCVTVSKVRCVRMVAAPGMPMYHGASLTAAHRSAWR